MANVSTIEVHVNGVLETQRNDALYALQSLVEYVNTVHLLPPELRKTDWTLEECLKGAREMREYKAA
jgi:hypothetical protein